MFDIKDYLSKLPFFYDISEEGDIYLIIDIFIKVFEKHLDLIQKIVDVSFEFQGEQEDFVNVISGRDQLSGDALTRKGEDYNVFRRPAPRIDGETDIEYQRRIDVPYRRRIRLARLLVNGKSSITYLNQIRKHNNLIKIRESWTENTFDVLSGGGFDTNQPPGVIDTFFDGTRELGGAKIQPASIDVVARQEADIRDEDIEFLEALVGAGVKVNRVIEAEKEEETTEE